MLVRRGSAAAVLLSAWLAGCAPEPKIVSAPKIDATKEPWYRDDTARLVELNQTAAKLAKDGRQDQAAAELEKAAPVVARLLAVQSPTFAAMEAASDTDRIHARMLMANRHYGWARMLFQKDAARWRNWTPTTEESIARQKAAESAMAECDRAIAK